MLILCCHITEGNRSVDLAGKSVFSHASQGFLCKLHRIILRHAFKQCFQKDALGPLGDCLGDGHELDAILRSVRL